MALCKTLLTFSRHLLYAGFLIYTQSVFSIELRPIEVIVGTKYQQHVPLAVNNQSTKSIECIAQLAHWYSASLFTVSPGKTATTQLWLDPVNSVINLLNDKDENMPVEVVWCGFSDTAYESRTLLEIDRTHFETAEHRQFVCRDDKLRLRCRNEQI